MWLRRLATDRIARASPTPDETPLVCVAEIKSARRITALNDAAARLNLTPGMALADARAMYPGLSVADADPQADGALLKRIADWCDRYTPLVGLDPPDGLILDIAGCTHLYHGEMALCRDFSHRLSAQGFHVRLATADSVGCAWAAARYGNPGLVAGGAMRETVAPLPLAALRLPPDTVEALAQTGLKRVADVLDRPRAPLAARFGEILLRRIDQALGTEEESIVPLGPVPSYVVERRFAEPIGREEDVLATIAHLAGELGRVLERQGEGARLLQVALFRADGKVMRIGIGTGEPLRDPVRIRRLFVDRLAVLADEYDPGFGFDMVRLCALKTERREETQTGLGGSDESEELTHLIDRLGARFGARRVSRLIPNDTHIPEFAALEVAANTAQAMEMKLPPPLRGRSPSEARREGGAFLSNACDSRNPPPHPSPMAKSDVSDLAHSRVTERENTRVQLGEGGIEQCQDSLAPTRPIRLFERAEPIEAIAEIPDGPPVRFRWRRVLHEVAHVEGPERIAMQWWRTEDGSKLTRDYFRIESRDGIRAWLYREGLYGRETAQPRWYLHGLFA